MKPRFTTSTPRALTIAFALGLGLSACGDNNALEVTCPTNVVELARNSADSRVDAALAQFVSVRGATGKAALQSSDDGHNGEVNLTVTASDDFGSTTSCNLTANIHPVYAPNARVISAHLDEEIGATVPVIGWDAAAGSEATHLRIEHSNNAAGPWQAVNLLEASATTSELPPIKAKQYYRLTSVRRDGETDLVGGTTVVVSDAIGAEQYHLRNQSVPGIEFATSLYGVVRMPRDGDHHPLVVFLHGNHANCYDAVGDETCEDIEGYECQMGKAVPNAEGYLYLMDTLAAQGFVAVSISGNALNCRADAIEERALLIVEHLRRWQAFASDQPPSPFEDGRLHAKIDFQNVHLVGHSRGGEAVNRVPSLLRESTLPGVALRSVVAIAPTDFHQQTPNHTNSATLLPACDGDVSTLEGKLAYDRATRTDDGFVHGQWFIPGTNHNWYNTTWEGDDDGGFFQCAEADRLSAASQRATLELLIGDWLRGTADNSRLPAYQRAVAVNPASQIAWVGEDVTYRFSYAGADRQNIDQCSLPLAENDLGLANDIALPPPVAFVDVANPGAFEDLELTPMRVELGGAANSKSVKFTLELDLAEAEALSMRVAQRYELSGGMANSPRLGMNIELTDSNGQQTVVSTEALPAIPAAGTDYNREILQSLRLELDLLRAQQPTFNWDRVVSMRLVGPLATDANSVFWLTDVEVDH